MVNSTSKSPSLKSKYASSNLTTTHTRAEQAAERNVHLACELKD